MSQRTDQTVRESEELYRTLVEASQGLVWRCDAEGRIVFLNHAWEQATGHRLDELRGRSFRDFQRPEVYARDVALFARSMAGESVTDYETTHLTKDGRELHLLLNAVPVRDPSGGVIGVQGTAVDISERKRAELKLTDSEHSLKLSEEQLLLAQQLGNTGSWVYTLATDRIWGSAQGLKMFGYPPVAGDFPIQDIEACIPERERVHQALVDLISEGRPYDLNYTIHPADRSPPKEIHSIARLTKDAAGNPLRVLGFVQDVTEQKRAEAELARLLAEAVEAKRLRDEVLGIVSHDLRNPLNTIALNAAVLAKKAIDDRAISGIKHAVSRANRLIQDLLLATSVEAGGLLLDRRPEPAGAIVNEVVAAHAELARAKSISLEAIVENAVAQAYVDRHRLVQLLSNLVANAIAFTPGGGRIVVRSGTVEGQPAFTVSDTGAGIAPEELDHIFDRFWQGAHSHRAGAGLGLAIAKGIADAHGAELLVDTEVGRGTTFTLCLPVTAPRRDGGVTDERTAS